MGKSFGQVKRTQILQATPWKNLHLVSRFSTHGIPLHVLPERFTHASDITAIHIKQNTDDEISSSTHRYANYIAPS